ncbi:MAG: hypothetical protein AB7E51_16175 [Pseudodesulfovibrio sp.]|uniref:hypothetical protein n=1 Tax=Pseudodesulfovibrio sp. TaxID=2035812 RepID=UPI003D0DCA46
MSSVCKICYWLFQLLNLPAAACLVLAPRVSHASLFSDPQRAYEALGFSPIAQDMLHNVLRGQGAALLAISLFLFFLGSRRKEGFLLIALTCLGTLFAHVATLAHHTQSPAVTAAIGSVAPLYVMIAVNGVIGMAGLACWHHLSKSALP